MTDLLTPEQRRDPGVRLSYLFGLAMTRRLTAEEVARAMELLTALRVQATEEAYRRVGKVVDDVLKERAA